LAAILTKLHAEEKNIAEFSGELRQRQEILFSIVLSHLIHKKRHKTRLDRGL